MKLSVKEMLIRATQQEASDLHISEGTKPMMRVKGMMVPMYDSFVLTRVDIEDIYRDFLGQPRYDAILQNGSQDFSFVIRDIGDFKGALIFKEHGIIGVFRCVP